MSVYTVKSVTSLIYPLSQNSQELFTCINTLLLTICAVAIPLAAYTHSIQSSDNNSRVLSRWVCGMTCLFFSLMKLAS